VRVNADVILQTMLAVLSVPIVGAVLAWLAQRFTREARLTLRLQRLSGIYSGLPEGAPRQEFARRVEEVAVELNKRLDPLFKRERRRKRIATGVIFTTVMFLGLVFPGFAWRSGVGGEWVHVAMGGALLGVFLLIERDTRRQRAVLARTHSPELAPTD
jgi:hypothetical protein